MFTINISKEEALEDVPRIEEWITIAEEKFGKIITEDNLSFYYTYSFFIPSEDESESYYEDIYDKCANMLYDERFEFELSNVTTNVAMKIDDLFISDKLDIETELPNIIEEVVSEVTKVKMILESEYSDNEEVKNSIPELDSTIVSIEGVKDIAGDKYKEKEDFDIDAILDKISKKGMDKLSEEEREFLNNKSKDI